MSKQDASQILASRPASQVAVIVIDVQVDLFDSTPCPFEATEVIHRINAVTSRARAANIRVFLVQNDGPDEGNWLRPFSPGWQLHPDLKKESADIPIRKTTGDAFYGTALETELRSRGIGSLLLVGYATDFCVDATLRNAVSKEFEIFVVSDAHTTSDAPMVKAPVIRQYFNWAWGDSSSRRGIHLLSAAEVRFAGQVSV